MNIYNFYQSLNIIGNYSTINYNHKLQTSGHPTFPPFRTRSVGAFLAAAVAAAAVAFALPGALGALA